MGASSSRGISIRNPEPPGKIIQITEDVAKRMMNRYGQPQHQQTTPAEQPQQVLTAEARTGGLLNVGSAGFPVVETVNAYEVRQQKDKELRENDAFWTTKLKDLEGRYVAAAFAAEGVFNKELEKLDKLVPQPKEPVCQDHTIKIAQCYEQNRNQALKCSDVVREFAVCVERHSQKSASAA